MPSFEYIDLSSLNAVVPDKHWDEFMQEVDNDVSYGSTDTETLIKSSKIVSIVDRMNIPDDELEEIQMKLKTILFNRVQEKDLYIRVD